MTLSEVGRCLLAREHRNLTYHLAASGRLSSREGTLQQAWGRLACSNSIAPSSRGSTSMPGDALAYRITGSLRS